MTPPRVTGQLVLNPDVEIVPVCEFPKDLRARLGGIASDFILSDRTSRIGSQRIGAAAAGLLRRFLEPRRIVEAVLEHSQDVQRDPAGLLDEVYPLLRELRAGAILVDPDVAYRRDLGRILAPGDVLGDYKIVACVSDLAETEIYRGEAGDGTVVALKFLRSGSDEQVRDNLRREVAVLRHLRDRGCAAVPRLHAAELDRDDPFVSLDWFEGQTLFALNRGGRLPLEGRARIAASLISAYCDVHSCGVLHGDVHPSNVVVLENGTIKLIDFGGASLMESDVSLTRVGLVHHYEPEVARAVLAGEEPPAPSLAGEQHTVAALVYSLITGVPHLLLSLETEAALRQIASEPPRPFEAVGESWPEVEAVVFRALAKDPADRYPTFDEFGLALQSALSTITTTEHNRSAAVCSAPLRSAPLDPDALCEQTVNQFIASHEVGADQTKRGLPRGPLASVYAGGAGIAYALFRIACIRQDAAALAAADVWVARALGQRQHSAAFSDGSVGAGTETGRLALFHSETGLHIINALVRHASGDETETAQAIRCFVEVVRTAAASSTGMFEAFPSDATNGASSLLMGAALLLPLCVPADAETRLRLITLGADLYDLVQRQLSTSRENRFLGFAHGRTGAIFSLLRWGEECGCRNPDRLGEALDDLGAYARRRGHGMFWPIDTADPVSPSWTGWCHGSAGHLLTWTLAARVLQRDDYLERALGAGENIWESQGKSGPSLCCGSAGEGLSLFELARATGDRIWIDRGLRLIAQAVQTSPHTNDAQGLFRSSPGIALAAAESADPMRSVWPICQPATQ